MARPLDDYKRKRDFSRTSEPPPAARAGREEGLAFVVHRHDARRLHYDLRLEREGVLLSFAIPKGFSYLPEDKHLAIRTEDHPLAYEDFHGVIPRGAYGAGTMTIWDRGRYELRPLKSGEDPLAAGELKLVLHGRKLRGEWHLVKTSGGKDHWLIFKSKDRYAGVKGDLALGIDLRAAEERAIPAQLPFMESGEARAPFTDPGWLFEARFDGLRLYAEKRGDQIAWRGAPRPLALPAIAADLAALRAALPPLAHALFMDHVMGEGESLASAVAAAGLPGLVAKRAAAPWAAGPSPDWCTVDVAPEGELATPVRRALDARRARERTSGRASARASKRRVKFTNQDKLYFPGEGFTKGDLLAYYESVADVLVPYLRGRPVHLNRFPDGIEGKSFYQKEAKEETPAWVRTATLASKSREEGVLRYVVCDDRETLLYLVNLGSIDLHPWMSRVESPDEPDYAVLDLDPKQAPYADVVRIARELGRILHEIGLRPLLKTSGKTGLHVVVPLEQGYTYEQTALFCEGIARLVVRGLPAIATVERSIPNREGKVYVDYGQNRKGQTVVPPYVVRPVRGATVSTPLAWDELDADPSPARFTLQTVPERLARLGDLFRPLFEDRQRLEPAAAKLEGSLGRRAR